MLIGTLNLSTVATATNFTVSEPIERLAYYRATLTDVDGTVASADFLGDEFLDLPELAAAPTDDDGALTLDMARRGTLTSSANVILRMWPSSTTETIFYVQKSRTDSLTLRIYKINYAYTTQNRQRVEGVVFNAVPSTTHRTSDPDHIVGWGRHRVRHRRHRDDHRGSRGKHLHDRPGGRLHDGMGRGDHSKRSPTGTVSANPEQRGQHAPRADRPDLHPLHRRRHLPCAQGRPGHHSRRQHGRSGSRRELPVGQCLLGRRRASAQLHPGRAWREGRAGDGWRGRWLGRRRLRLGDRRQHRSHALRQARARRRHRHHLGHLRSLPPEISASVCRRSMAATPSRRSCSPSG